MGLFVNVVGVVFFIAFITFVLFFGRLPALRRTPIGALHRLLLVHIPRALYALDHKISNGRIYASGAETFHFIMYERHPTVLILFIVLLTVSEYLYLPSVYPTQSFATKVVIVPIVTLPYLFLYLSASTDPGFITPLTHPQHMSLYPYDHINYHPSISCSTCNLPKPARSKHCSLCNRCVARSDHHCIFINGCVGYGNTHWFILLLISTSTLVVAGAHLGIHYVAAVIQTTYPSFTPRGKGFAWRDYWNFWLWGLHQKPGAGGVTLLCVLSSLLVVALGVYTLYQVWAGITTNESGKWDDVKLDIEDEMLFMRPIDERRVRRRDVEPYVRWPVEAKIVAVSRDTMPAKDERELREIGVGPWRAVRSIHELENIYDIGFWRNIGDIFLPREMAERWISGF